MQPEYVHPDVLYRPNQVSAKEMPMFPYNVDAIDCLEEVSSVANQPFEDERHADFALS